MKNLRGTEGARVSSCLTMEIDLRHLTKSFFTVLLIVVSASSASASILIHVIEEVGLALRSGDASEVMDLARMQMAIRAHPLESTVNQKALRELVNDDLAVLVARPDRAVRFGNEIYLRLIKAERSHGIDVEIISRSTYQLGSKTDAFDYFNFDNLLSEARSSAKYGEKINKALIRVNTTDFERPLEKAIRRELQNAGIDSEPYVLREQHFYARAPGKRNPLTNLIDTIRIPADLAEQIDAKTMGVVIHALLK